MLDSLLSLLNGPTRKEAIILTIFTKKIHGRAEELNVAIQEANHSTKGAEILFAAVDKGYHKLFSRLLKLGFDPSIPLPPFGFNVLHHCVLNNLPTMLNTCLHESTAPLLETFSREGATPLFLAVQQQNANLVNKLLAKGATVNTCDVHGLTPVGAALLTANAEILERLLAAPQSSPIIFDDLSCQTRLLQTFNDLLFPHSYKVRCLNLLLAAGSGLELNHIPEGIFTLYGLQKSNVQDCLVLGEHQQPDGTWKKKLISSIERLTSALQAPTWRFNRNQLARTCQHPLLQHLPAIQTLRALLAHEVENIPAFTPPIGYSQHPVATTLSVSAFRIEPELTLAHNCLRTINSLIRPQTCLPRLSTLTTSVMQSVQNLIDVSHNIPGAGEQSFGLFNALIASLMPVINTSVSLTALPLLGLLDKKIAHILKVHDTLSASQQNFYNSLIDARALLNAKSARAFLLEGNHDVAIHLALNGLTLNKQMIIDNPMLQSSADLTEAICLGSTAEVYLTQGWINKAYEYTFQAIDLLKSSGMYDELVVKQISEFAKLFAQRHHVARSLALIDKGIDYLTPLFLLNDEQAIAKPINIADLKELRLQLLNTHFHANVQLLTEHLGNVCDIMVYEEEQSVYLQPKVNVFEPEIAEAYFGFLLANPGFKQEHSSQLMIEQQTLFGKGFMSKIRELAAILSPTPKLTLPAALAEGIASLSLGSIEETYGFQKPVGFTPIVPIQSSRLPHQTLFLTMPEDNDAFVPFYKLIRDQHRTTYYPVQAVAPKGLNQQGVKLRTTIVHQPGQPSEKRAVGRLKVAGTCRATGMVEQAVWDSNGKLRKLYVFREVTDKKSEKRHNYGL